jgi:hypothetical protein
MSDQDDWEFADAEEARAEIRAAVRYLLKGAAGSDRGDIAREIIEIVGEVARGLAAWRRRSPRRRHDSRNATGDPEFAGCDVPADGCQSSTVAPIGLGGCRWGDRAGRAIAGKRDPLRQSAFVRGVP